MKAMSVECYEVGRYEDEVAAILADLLGGTIKTDEDALTGRTNRWLEVPGKNPAIDLMDLARDEVKRLTIAAARLNQAIADRYQAEQESIL